jgi:tetratricopeptide (TPR) repeat protein
VPAWRRIAVRAAALAATAAVVLAAGLAGARLLGARRAARSFEEQIREVDEQAGRGFLAKAKAGLRSAASSARSERDWLRLLKRARAAASATGSYAELAELARRAAQGIPGSRPLARLALWGRLRAGQNPGELPARALSSDPDLQYLLAEAAALRQLPAPEGLSPELKNLLAARLRPEAESLQALAERWQDGALLQDAGLAWMASGNTGRAAAAFRQLPDGPTARELRLAAAYDAGSWEEALRLLEAEPRASAEMALMRADLLLILGRESEAAGAYQQTIARDPKLFWSPYLNLAGILAARGEADAAAELYRRAYELFPESEAPANALLAVLVRTGQREEAFAVLRRSLQQQPDSLPLRWLLLELGRGQSGEQRYQAGLGKLYAEHPDSGPLAQALSTLLLGLSDTSGAWAVLEEYQGPAGESWLLEARGLVKALEGDLTAGAEFLKRSLDAGGDGRTRCNLAIILAAAGETEAAVQQFLQACGQLTGRPPLESRARALLAGELLRLGNRAAARREAAYALQLDPANGRALLLLRTLEGE